MGKTAKHIAQAKAKDGQEPAPRNKKKKDQKMTKPNKKTVTKRILWGLITWEAEE